MGEGALQGATFGTADEIGGFFSGVGSWFDPDESFGEAYSRRRDQLREDYEKAQRDRAGWTLGGELAGGLTTGLFTGGGGAAAGLGRAAGRQGLKQAAAQAAKTGAKYGALAGAGYSEADLVQAGADDYDLGQLGQFGADVGLGAGTGALLGAGTQAALHGAAGGLGRLSRLAPTQRGAERRALHTVGRALDDDIQRFQLGDDVKAKSAQEIIDLAREQPALRVGEMGGHTQALVERAIQRGGDGSMALEAFFAKQAAGKNPRTVQGLRRVMGIGDDDFHSMLQRHQARLKTLDAENFGRAREVPVTPAMVNDFRPIVSPKGRAGVDVTTALAETRKIAGAGANPRQIRSLDDFTMDDFQNFRIALRELKDRLYKGEGRGRLAAEVDTTFQRVDKLLNKHNPLLSEANVASFSERANKEALDLGLNMLKPSVNFHPSVFDSMSEPAKQHFRVGLFTLLSRRGGKKGDLAALIRETPELRDAIRMAYGGSPKQLEVFMRQLDAEAKKAAAAKLAGRAAATDEVAKKNMLGKLGGIIAGTKLGQLFGGHTMATAGTVGAAGARIPPPRLPWQRQTNDAMAQLLMGSPEQVINRGALQGGGLPQFTNVIDPVAGLLGGKAQQ